ncbi:MAG: CRISPR system precrRNA processing endoribonuclease RAMP protein Cas6 [Fusobacteriaceae bacterium]
MLYSFLVKFKIISLNEKFKKIDNFEKKNLFKNLNNNKIIINNIKTKDKEFVFNKTYSIKVNCFDSESMKALSSYFIRVQSFSEKINFYNQKAIVEEVLFQKKEIQKKDFKDTNKIRINFVSPTLFRFGDTYYSEPNPYLYLLKTYKKYEEVFSKEKALKDFQSIPKFIFKKIGFENINIKTKKIRIEKLEYSAFLGKVDFILSHDDVKEHKDKIIELLKFSEYVGVGEFTDFGMGEINIE